ncbi:MAG: hypothetical protein KAI47_00045 [Deltaproteobacteria bacterium]|nr:hypothetical protein [Deltaproteobacteria bacterium]
MMPWQDACGRVRGFAGVSASKIFAITNCGETIDNIAGFVLKLVSSTWTKESNLPIKGNALSAIWGSVADNELYVCGLTHGCAVLRSGRWSWRTQSIALPYLSGQTLANLHGGYTDIRKYQSYGKSWMVVKKLNAGSSALWVHNDDIFVAVERDDFTLMWRHENVWHEEILSSGFPVTSIWGDQKGTTYAIAGYHILRLRKGQTSWQRVQTGLPNRIFLRSIWGTGSDDIVVVGKRGTIITWDGTRWASTKAPVSVDLTAVWAFNRDVMFIGGKDGAILRRGRDCQ